jgi:L-threonylcarbamoyladenylate synthase
MLVIDQKNSNAVNVAIDFLQKGKVICFATDTVYGVAVDATNPKAVERLYQLKNREKNKPIAIFLKDLESAKKIFIFNDLAKKIAQKYMPGRITIILRTTHFAKKILAKNLNINDDGFIGFRIVDSYFIEKLFQKYNGVLAVSSANKAFEDACSSASSVRKKLKNLDLLIAGKKTSKIASTIVKIDDNQITLIRQGKLIIQDYDYK